MGKKVTFPTSVHQDNAWDVAIADYYASGLSQISFLAHARQCMSWLCSRKFLQWPHTETAANDLAGVIPRRGKRVLC